MDDLLDVPTETLPLWMRQARQTVDWGVVLTICLSLVMAWPFIFQDGLPRTNDTEKYVFMTANYASDLQQGRLYPRWSAAAAQGYGAPIPHYFPPGTPYTAAILQLLIFDNPVHAIRALYVIALCLAGGTLYAFVLRWTGALAAVLATTLFIYSPYMGLTATHLTGDLPGVMAMALLTSLLWSTGRLFTRSQTADLLLNVLLWAALILTRPQSLPVAAGIVLLFALAVAIRNKQPLRLLWILTALILGAGLSSFYWLSAWIEQDLVQWHSQPYTPLYYALNLENLVAPLRRIDLNALIPTPQFKLGIPLIVLATLSVPPIIRRVRQNWMEAYFGLIGIVLSALAIIWLPQEVSLLGPITLCFSLMAVAIFKAFPENRQRLILPLIMVGIAVLTMPTLLPPRWMGAYGETDLQAQFLYEQQGFGSPLLPATYDVPLTVSPDLEPDNAVIASLSERNTLRLPQNQLSIGRQASLITGNSHQDRYLVTLLDDTEFQLNRAYFTGWEAQLNDGGRVLLQPNPETNLIDLSLPPMRDEILVINLGATDVRRTSWRISGVALVLLIVMTIWRARTKPKQVGYDSLALLSREDARLITVMVSGIAVAVVLFALPQSPFSLHARPGYRLDDTIGLRNLTGVGLEALSYDLNQTEFTIGETLEFSIAWRSLRPLLDNYGVRVSLVQEGFGARWALSETRYLGQFPTRRWTPNRYVLDSYRIPITEGLSSGEYQINVELVPCTPDCNVNPPVSFFDNGGALIGQSLKLPSIIRVVRE